MHIGANKGDPCQNESDPQETLPPQPDKINADPEPSKKKHSLD
jgi:hypothetical protein